MPERGLRPDSGFSLLHPASRGCHGNGASSDGCRVPGEAETLVPGLDVALGQAAQSRGLGWKCWGEVWGLGWGWRGQS